MLLQCNRTSTVRSLLCFQDTQHAGAVLTSPPLNLILLETFRLLLQVLFKQFSFCLFGSSLRLQPRNLTELTISARFHRLCCHGSRLCPLYGLAPSFCKRSGDYVQQRLRCGARWLRTNEVLPKVHRRGPGTWQTGLQHVKPALESSQPGRLSADLLLESLSRISCCASHVPQVTKQGLQVRMLLGQLWQIQHCRHHLSLDASLNQFWYVFGLLRPGLQPRRTCAFWCFQHSQGLAQAQKTALLMKSPSHAMLVEPVEQLSQGNPLIVIRV
mmetsp:Transcript_133047/g.315344  ORF Transcript_133047/g.315344 Transcript_133047/m.315344 type:complete len:271 (+) Transcript_133047:248-1060(+)